MIQGIVNVPGSLHFGGNLRWIIAEAFSPTLRISLPFSFLFDVQSSFRNLAYLGTCLIASRRGIFTSTFWKVSSNSFSNSSFFDLFLLLGKGRGIQSVEVLDWDFDCSSGGCSVVYLFSTSNFTLSFGITSGGFWIGLSTFFPLLRLILLAFSHGLMIVWEGNFSDPWTSNLPIDVANWLIYFSRFWMLLLVSCWNCKVLVASIFTMSSMGGLEFWITDGLGWGWGWKGGRYWFIWLFP